VSNWKMGTGAARRARAHRSNPERARFRNVHGERNSHLKQAQTSSRLLRRRGSRARNAASLPDAPWRAAGDRPMSRTIVHLSDIHFGTVDESLLDPLVSAVVAAKPD